jgi:DMSO reductase anchor subunit
MLVFWVMAVMLALATLFKKWSLIPLLGLVTCLYLLTGMTAMNWAWFGSWLTLGLINYFIYGYRKRKLNVES